MQTNFDLLKNENVEIQKRYSNLLENVNRQDIKTQQAAEDLVAAKGMIDSLQRENFSQNFCEIKGDLKK